MSKLVNKLIELGYKRSAVVNINIYVKEYNDGHHISIILNNEGDRVTDWSIDSCTSYLGEENIRIIMTRYGQIQSDLDKIGGEYEK